MARCRTLHEIAATAFFVQQHGEQTAAGFTKEAQTIVDALHERYASTGGGPGEIAQVYIGLGEFDRASEWLTRAVDEGSVWTRKVAVVWDPLRADPRFAQLLGRAGY
jgi:hypothetical protein